MTFEFKISLDQDIFIFWRRGHFHFNNF